MGFARCDPSSRKITPNISVLPTALTFPNFSRAYSSTCTFRLENLNPNGFDQLCRNYAVERLHGKFLQDMTPSGGVDDRQGGMFRSPSFDELSVQADHSRQLLAMFEGEGRVRDQ